MRFIDNLLWGSKLLAIGGRRGGWGLFLAFFASVSVILVLSALSFICVAYALETAFTSDGGLFALSVMHLAAWSLSIVLLKWAFSGPGKGFSMAGYVRTVLPACLLPSLLVVSFGLHGDGPLWPFLLSSVLVSWAIRDCGAIRYKRLTPVDGFAMRKVGYIRSAMPDLLPWPMDHHPTLWEYQTLSIDFCYSMVMDWLLANPWHRDVWIPSVTMGTRGGIVPIGRVTVTFEDERLYGK